jgi:predicted transcriptional regulator
MWGNLLIRTENKVSNNHRGNLDIIADILNACRGGVKKSYLMYRCNLSFKQLKHYSRFLLINGLIRLNLQETEYNGGLYEPTEKGRQFLKAYKGLKALMQ